MNRQHMLRYSTLPLLILSCGLLVQGEAQNIDEARIKTVVKEYFQGNYREIPVKTIILITAALIYFVSPVDAIPDFLIGIGYVDDISVIAYVFRALNEDIESFKNWKEGKEGLESE